MTPATPAMAPLRPAAPGSSVPLASGAQGRAHGNAGFFSHHGIWAPGVRLFRSLHFATKALIISMAFVFPFLSMLVWQLNHQAEQALQARMDATRQHVEVAHGVLVWAQAQEAAGRMSREQAQQAAAQAVAQLRYEGKEYFWINDMQARVVMHPTQPELNGKDASAIKDPQGFPLFVGFVDAVKRNGQGFVGYQSRQRGSDGPVNQLSYVKGFAPWGWVVGSGIPIDDLKAAHRSEMAWVLVISSAALLLAGYLFYSFYRVMDGGLRETSRHLRAMTEGDLTTSPRPWGKDEAAQLMIELRAMQDSLRGMVARVRVSSQQIVQSSSEIASGALDLSARTEQAAANLQQSAASMEEIAATVTQSAAHTAEASKVARQSAEAAANGGRVMGEVVATMEGIRESSAKIGDIIGVIDSIAFQTNILALNAAVEAARAGEQGRGFAVVASEVRGLAQRSAAAAREIKTLVGRSVNQVEAGAGVVRKAGATIEDTVDSSRRVDALLGSVANGAQEQSQGIAQIGVSVQELDRMTQQNAALVEQTAAAAAAMKEQALVLAGEVARFRMPRG